MTPITLTINLQYKLSQRLIFGGGDEAEALRALKAWLDDNYTRRPVADRDHPAIKVKTPDGPKFITLHFSGELPARPWQVDAVDPESGRRAAFHYVQWEAARDCFIDQAASFGEWRGNGG